MSFQNKWRGLEAAPSPPLQLRPYSFLCLQNSIRETRSRGGIKKLLQPAGSGRFRFGEDRRVLAEGNTGDLEQGGDIHTRLVPVGDTGQLNQTWRPENITKLVNYWSRIVKRCHWQYGIFDSLIHWQSPNFHWKYQKRGTSSDIRELQIPIRYCHWRL